MSTPQAGRPDAGRDAALGLLASELSDLAARVKTAEAAIMGQARTVAEAAGLAHEVTRLSEAVAAASSAGEERDPLAHPRVWAGMDDETYLDALRDLARWVAQILLERYRHVGPLLPPCWPAHHAAVEELDWLYWDWTGWALGRDGRSRDAADWHDRWLPGVLARIGPYLEACVQNRGHVKPSFDRAVPQELVLPGEAPEAVFIEQMGRAGRAGAQ